MDAAADLPLLLFFTSERSGPGRRMESLLAHLARKERSRLRISRVDVDRSPELVSRLDISEVPSLVLVKRGRPLERIEGRVSAPRIERMLAPHLPAVQAAPVEAA
jgi:thioredoxin-like negative regulator of GroEL